jgi:uncharacterized protein (TIGR02246 family)
MNESMAEDEKAIRDLVDRWMRASKAGDVETVLGLMSDDVVFMVPGREPFGKKEFAAASMGLAGVKMQGTSEIVELKVMGNWGWIRNKLRLEITPPGGERLVRAGYTLTILRKDEKGKWVVARDANLLSAGY